MLFRSMPLAAFTRGPTSGGSGGMLLQAAWGDPASIEAGTITPLVHAQQTAWVNTFAEAEALGEAVAAQLRAGGAVWASNSTGDTAA